MKLMIIILKDESLLDRISSILLEVGLFDSSVLDGESIESLSDEGLPLFASFKSLFGKEYSYNRTLFIPVGDARDIKVFLHICQKEGIDFSNPEKACLMTLPCQIYDGSNGDSL